MTWGLMVYMVGWLLSSMAIAIATDEEFGHWGWGLQGFISIMIGSMWPLLWIPLLVSLPAIYIRHRKEAGEK